MAGVLGVHAADIKVVSVYEGSTIVDFEVIQRDAEVVEPEELIQLETVSEKFSSYVADKVEFMGSKILDAQVKGTKIVTPPPVLVKDTSPKPAKTPTMSSVYAEMIKNFPKNAMIFQPDDDEEEQKEE